jgi:XTP/dITP diphosphohydrolase
MRVVLATANRGKQRELAALLAPLGLALELAADLGIGSPEETGATFEANALLKARHASQLASLPALADDSGLEVDALGGRPGVHSARYAGAGAADRDNTARLLAELAGVPVPRRAARYRCVLALVRSADDPAPLLAYGSWEGRIAFVPSGAGGFGYDPVFIPEGCEQTVAELPAAFKQQRSHRARAAADLAAQLRAGAL